MIFGLPIVKFIGIDGNRLTTKKMHGLFVGMVTLDLIYLAAEVPKNNQKLVASDYTISAGGPATNAAVAFAYWHHQATLLGVVGCHPMTQLIKQDLASYQVAIADLNSEQSEPPPISSIIITQSTGDRAVISLNASKIQALSSHIPKDIVQNIDVVLIDGHQMEVGYRIAQAANSKNIPIVIDGGSWKPGFDTLLPFVNYAICSANFYPPNCHSAEEVIRYLSAQGIAHIAITNGQKPIQYFSQGNQGWIEIPPVKTMDTLGAGDIFHGAFCHYILQENFTNALKSAAKIAAYSCQFFGTRRWMRE
jgi:sugar/nucleoside kinase (ribokinase family)